MHHRQMLSKNVTLKEKGHFCPNLIDISKDAKVSFISAVPGFHVFDSSFSPLSGTN